MFLIVLSALAFAAEPMLISEGPEITKSGEKCLYYFYGDGCDGCAETSQYIKDLQKESPNLMVESYEVYYNKDSFYLLRDFFTKYNIPKESQGLPVVFTATTYFVGKEGILNLMSESVSSECPSLENNKVIGIVGEKSSKSVLENLTFIAITSSAFLNAFTLGPLALMLVLVLIITGLRETEKVLARGLFFIFGIYLAYLLFGFGLFSWLAYSGIAVFFAKLIALIAIIFSLATLKHFFISWEVTFKNFSKDIKSTLLRLVELVTSYAGTLISGFTLALLSFTTLNKPFLLTRYLFVEGSQRLISIPIMLYYLLIFVLPFLLIVLIIYTLREYWEKKAHERFKLHERRALLWKQHYLKVLNFILQLFVLLLGVIVLFL